MDRDLCNKLWQRALVLLGKRDYAVSRLRGKLAAYGAQFTSADLDSCLEETIKQLQSEGLVDDARFAHHWIENKLRTRPRGQLLLRAELQKQGIEAEVIREALETTLPRGGDVELEAAVTLAQKRVKAYRLDDPSKRWGKLARYLAGKGFSYEIIKRAVDAALRLP
jgi:regulatory protein